MGNPRNQGTRKKRTLGLLAEPEGRQNYLLGPVHPFGSLAALTVPPSGR